MLNRWNFLKTGFYEGIKVYPAWLGWSISAVGILGAAVGFVLGVAGLSDVLLIGFIAALVLTSVWAVAMGFVTLRKAW